MSPRTVTGPTEALANVTPRDIALGVPRECQTCPAARAILRVMRKYGCTWVRIGSAYNAGSAYGTAGNGRGPGNVLFKLDPSPQLLELVKRVDDSVRYPPPKPGHYRFTIVPL